MTNAWISSPNRHTAYHPGVVNYSMGKDYTFYGHTPNWKDIVGRCEDLTHADRAARSALRRERQQKFDTQLPGEHATQEEMQSWQDRQAEAMQREMDRVFNR